MSGIERVQVKRFASSGAPEANALIDVFHGWIRDTKITGDTLVDVADYTHVLDGPGVILVGHGADIYWDLVGGPGVLFSRKRALEGDFEVLLRDAVERMKHAETLLADEIGVTFDESRVLVRVPDRLHVRNDDAGFENVKGALEAVFPGATLTRIGEAREALSIEVRLG